MKHYGDIRKISGYELPIVDIVTGGSPCQDLSIAGRREGLGGERSGLFMEQIRVIKEMRENDRRTNGRTNEHIRPRYMVWENVPGAFSSNKGEDFRAVLEETAKVADEAAVIPRLEKGEKWPYAGCVMGEGWSIAWRIHDAQFWGVPQRRKRIALVADFGGQTAPEILFEREGVSGDIDEGKQEREETAGNIRTGTTQPDRAFTLKIRGGADRDCYGKKAGKGALVQTEKSATLGVSQDQTLITIGINGNVAGTLDASYYKGCGERQGVEREVVCIGNGQLHQISMSQKANTLDTMHDQQAIITFGIDAHNVSVTEDNTNALLAGNNDNHNVPTVCYGLDRASFNQGKNAKYDFSVEEEIAPTIVAKGPGGGINRTVGALCARDYKGVGSQYVSEGKVIVQDI